MRSLSWGPELSSYRQRPETDQTVVTWRWSGKLEALHLLSWRILSDGWRWRCQYQISPLRDSPSSRRGRWRREGRRAGRPYSPGGTSLEEYRVPVLCWVIVWSLTFQIITGDFFPVENYFSFWIDECYVEIEKYIWKKETKYESMKWQKSYPARRSFLSVRQTPPRSQSCSACRFPPCPWTTEMWELSGLWSLLTWRMRRCKELLSLRTELRIELCWKLLYV